MQEKIVTQTRKKPVKSEVQAKIEQEDEKKTKRGRPKKAMQSPNDRMMRGYEKK